jgi:hypothetical protein
MSERSRGQSSGARMLGGIFASSSGVRLRHSRSPRWLIESLIKATSSGDLLVFRPGGKGADECGKSAVEDHLADDGRRV